MRLILAVIFGWLIWSIWKKTLLKKYKKQPEQQAISSGEMISCKSCGTFILISDSIESRGERFCSEHCIAKR